MRFPLLLLALLTSSAAVPAAAEPSLPTPKFRMIEIDGAIQIGYGVAVSDVDGDGALDILLADKRQFVWYRNPGLAMSASPWKKHVLAENLTEHDNVCIAAQDLDGDGKCEIAVGAEWNPSDTIGSGAVFYLQPPADRTQRWEPIRLHHEPTVHRMRWVQPKSGGEWMLVVAPLHGRANRRAEGAGVKILGYRKPTDPRAEWPTELINGDLHATHNFDATVFEDSPCLLIGSREGIYFTSQEEGKWSSFQIAKNSSLPATPSGAGAGAGEVRLGHLARDRAFVAAIEPMHGTTLAVYNVQGGLPERQLLDDRMVDGHALACGDLLGLGRDQIIAGWRGRGKAGEPTGMRIWTPLDKKGSEWRSHDLDLGGMACEDLALADLNGDGRLDIVASGRATKNLRIYLNETPVPVRADRAQFLRECLDAAVTEHTANFDAYSNYPYDLDKSDLLNGLQEVMQAQPDRLQGVLIRGPEEPLGAYRIIVALAEEGAVRLNALVYAHERIVKKGSGLLPATRFAELSHRLLQTPLLTSGDPAGTRRADPSSAQELSSDLLIAFRAGDGFARRFGSTGQMDEKAGAELFAFLEEQFSAIKQTYPADR